MEDDIQQLLLQLPVQRLHTYLTLELRPYTRHLQQAFQQYAQGIRNEEPDVQLDVEAEAEQSVNECYDSVAHERLLLQFIERHACVLSGDDITPEQSRRVLLSFANHMIPRHSLVQLLTRRVVEWYRERPSRSAPSSPLLLPTLSPQAPPSMMLEEPVSPVSLPPLISEEEADEQLAAATDIV